jgi:hypothetical protein
MIPKRRERSRFWEGLLRIEPPRRQERQKTKSGRISGGPLKPMIARVGRSQFLLLGDLGVLAVGFFKLEQTTRHWLAPSEPAE